MDIILVYSGGTQNAIQQNSLGGFPSPVEVDNEEKNNLFNDISPRQTTLGVTDYRCLYIFNDDSTRRMEVTLFFSYLNDVGASMRLGFLQQNAVQSLSFPVLATSGTFTLTIQGLTTSVINWDNDSDVLAENIETAIQTITDCEISAVSPFSYNITFKGVLGNKSLTTMSVTNNNLEPIGTIVPTVQQVTTGSPINTIAPDTGLENLSPTGVPFLNVLTPGIQIGTLFPSEGFPLWFKRSIDPGFDPVEGDGFNLHIKSKIST